MERDWYYRNFNDKLTYYRIHHKNRTLVDEYVERIVKRFGFKIFNRSSVFFDYAEWALKWAMQNKGIDTALEIGTWHGIASAIMSKYAKKVITLEIVNDLTNPNIKFEIWDYLGIKNIEPILIQSESHKEKILADLKFDFCYMDGGHANYTYSDWMMVRKCRNVLMHEYWEKQMPVWDLVNSLPREEIGVYSHEGKPLDYVLWTKK